MIAQELTAELQECVTHCLECHRICLGAAMKYHLNAEANRIEPAHVRLLIHCAEIYHTTATAILVGAPLLKPTCRVCAKVCRRCAADAERHGGMRSGLSALCRFLSACGRVS